MRGSLAHTWFFPIEHIIAGNSTGYCGFIERLIAAGVHLKVVKEWMGIVILGIYFWGWKWLTVFGCTVHEHFEYLKPMLNCLAISTSMCRWHKNTVRPLWQNDEIGLIFI